ncbi:MAG: restriction endonuclease subunit S [Rhodocyclaceae bacterium]|nr:restriction endonuclease subunit S [Rhodocyclaceae bacterium]
MGREGEYGEFGEGNGVKAWQQLSLGDIADIQTGPFGSQLHAADYVDSGIPSIMPTNIGNRLEIRTEGIACIKEADAQRLERYLVRVNDVVYSRRGDVEKCAFITSRENGWLCGTGCLPGKVYLKRKSNPGSVPTTVD